MKLQSTRLPPDEVAAVLVGEQVDRIDELPAPTLRRARDFYRLHRPEIVDRMRRPTDPTKNVAAVLVALCETDRRLSAEAARAIETARRARQARAVLDLTMDVYVAPRRSRPRPRG